MADADSTQKDLYYVAVKIFLEKEGKFLIFKDKFNSWDLPGGRIKKHEFDAPIGDVIARKVEEELGNNVSYRLLDRTPSILMRHERIEASTGLPARIFALGYRAEYLAGDIAMSDMHSELLWADRKTFAPEDYFTGGWLKGVQEYLIANFQN